MPKTSHRNVVLVVPEGEAIEALLDRTDPGGGGRRLLRAVESVGGRDGLRRLFAALYLQGMREGVDRALATFPATGTALGESPGEPWAEPPDPLPPALRELEEPQEKARSAIQVVVERFRREELRLPALPEVSVQLNRLLADPDHDLDAVIDLVKRDVALSARVMKLGSSPAYSTGGRAPKNLHESIVRLGARELSRQLLAFSNRRLFAFRCRAREHALRDIWHHSLATAVIAEHLATAVPGLHAPTCFLHGLLHDIGRALLFQIFDEVDGEGTATFRPEEVARTIDSLHGQFGAALLQRWRFDDSYSEVSMFHHQPQKAFENVRLVATVALSASLARRAGFGRDEDPWQEVDLALHPATAMLAVSAEHLAGVEPHLRRQFELMGDLA